MSLEYTRDAEPGKSCSAVNKRVSSVAFRYIIAECLKADDAFSLVGPLVASWISRVVVMKLSYPITKVQFLNVIIKPRFADAWILGLPMALLHICYINPLCIGARYSDCS